jgi:hypothetical protein
MSELPNGNVWHIKIAQMDKFSILYKVLYDKTDTAHNKYQRTTTDWDKDESREDS